MSCLRIQSIGGPAPASAIPALQLVALDSPADVLALLEEQVNQVRADPLAEPTERARTLGMLAGLALRAMDSRDLAARLEAVERVLKLRRDAERDDAKRRNHHGRQ